jgi:sister chromatid cohesion protein DCC1
MSIVAEGAPPVQVRFAPTFGNKRLRMMEMSQPLLDTVMKEGSVQIKGRQEDEAVLCTSDKTYQIRFLEYSNAQLLVDPSTGSEDCTVVAQAPGYYELKEMRPRILRIGEVLGGHVYSAESQSGGILFTELASIVQASTEEIKAELEQIGALEIEGRWWQLAPEYRADIMDSVLDLVVEHDWPLGKSIFPRPLSFRAPHYCNTHRRHPLLNLCDRRPSCGPKLYSCSCGAMSARSLW